MRIPIYTLYDLYIYSQDLKYNRIYESKPLTARIKEGIKVTSCVEKHIGSNDGKGIYVT